ncbi:MAG TPA: glycosyltransferase family 4 protein [Anaerolineales bacterium]|nr:glycosyltransferase family 4 protein [Anaerolineales bacterium]
MNILMPTPRFYPEMGGVETHVFQVGRRLAANGHNITVLTTDRTRQLPTDQVMDGIHVHRVPAWPRNSDFYFAPGIYDEILKRPWDILHIQSYHTFVAPFAMLAALRMKRPFVLTFHGGGHSSRLRHSLRIFQRFILRPLLARANRLVAVAKFEIGMFSNELKLPIERFELIPNGIELPQIKQGVKDFQKEVMITSVGRLERYKGHQRAIAALPYLLRRKPEARLWIAGSGPYEDELRGLARRLGVENKVEIRAVAPQEREQFAQQLSKSSLFVLFSEYETHPLAALEAISLGCPALVSDTSGLHELAENGLAKAMPLNCSDEQLAEEMIRQLDQPLSPKSIKLPTWDDCASGLLTLYQGIIEECAS